MYQSPLRFVGVDRQSLGPSWDLRCFEPGWFLIAGRPWFEGYQVYGPLGSTDSSGNPVFLYLGGNPC